MGTHLRVLSVEDSERDAALLRRHLERAGYELTFARVETPAAMRAALETREWDIILADYTMPQFGALAALALLKETGLDIPFIVISGTVGEELAVEAMRVGANDYMMKDKLARLAPAVERELHEAENRRARRRAENALRESEDRYRDLVEHSQELICTHDLAGRLLSVNPWAAKVLGYDRDDLLKKNMRDFLVPEFGNQFDDYLAAVQREGFARGLLVVQTATGEARVWEYNNSLRTEGVEVPIVRGIAHDVTERRQAEEALRESEARYRLLFESNPHPMWVYDLETLSFLAVNEAAVRHYGYSREEFHAMTIKDIRPPEDILPLMENVVRVRRGIDVAGAWKHRKKDGVVIDVEVTSHSLTFAGRRAEVVLASDITERKRAEQQLRLQAAALQAAANAIVITDNRGTISWVNPAFTTLTGYTLEEVLGRSTRILKSGRHDAAFYKTLWDTILSRQVFHGEMTNRRKDGSLYFEEQTITPVTDEAGALIHFVAIKQDVTDRRRAEEERARLGAQIESQRRRLNNIVASVPGVVWEAWGEPDNAAQRINFVSDYVETMLGYTVEEWLQTPNFWLSIVHPEDRPRTARAAADFADGKSSNTLEFRWVAKNGRALWVQTNSAVITDEEARPVGLRGVTIDITERKKTEAALREAEEKYRTIFENAVEGIFQSTPDGRFLAVNPAMARILGYESPEELLTHRTDIGTQHYVDENSRATLKQVLAEQGFVVGFECEVFRKDMSRIWTVENIRAVRDEGGGPVYYEGSIEDITERKTLEQQLRQSQKMEAVGQLAGGIAHDFNNLLTAINGYSELTMMRLRAEDPLRRNLEEIKKAGDRAAALTRQLLAFSRKQVLQPKVLDLNSVVSGLENMLRRLIGEDVDLRTALKPEPGSVKADPGQIEQVIMNLAVNARDAMPRGGKLTIETGNIYLDEEYARRHVAVSPGQYVMLAVSDTGTGMDEQTRARIFEPFFTTKESGKGTGLGLSTVYGIVKQSGGNIWVYSEVGRGTTFKVYLPLVGEAGQEYRRSDEVEEAAKGTETVLLAEDEEVVRTLAREVLETYGYRVVEAANGGAALLICERHREPIHLLITDVVMPEMSGRELADRLAPLRSEMKVLYMSGYTDNAIVHQGVLDEGANFIQKPFAPGQLARKVREVLDEEVRRS
jgi:two-component system, cell cycle sensor histidine kinase and response regulator CckA